MFGVVVSVRVVVRMVVSVGMMWVCRLRRVGHNDYLFSSRPVLFSVCLASV